MSDMSITSRFTSVSRGSSVCLRENASRRWVSEAPRSAAPMARSISMRSEEHTSELQSLMRISYAVFCLKKKKLISNLHSQPRAITKYVHITADIHKSYVHYDTQF